jgi:hypothetical protein
MRAGTPLAGLRKDGSTFTVRISLIPVTTATGHYTLTMIRDVTRPRRAASQPTFTRTPSQLNGSTGNC